MWRRENKEEEGGGKGEGEGKGEREREREEETYVYEVFPTNFYMLSPERQSGVVEAFAGFLNALSCELKIYSVKSSRTVDLGEGRSFEVAYRRFFMESREPIDHLLSMVGLKYQRAMEVQGVSIVKEFPRCVALEGGGLMKAFTIISLPGVLEEGFITGTYGVADRVMISVKPIRADAAVKRVEKFRRLIRGLALYEVSKGGSAEKKVEALTAKVEGLLNALVAGHVRLFDVGVNVCVAGRDGDELRANERKLKERLGARQVSVDSPSHLQSEMVLGLEGKRLVMDTSTAACFFPFVSEDVIETPGGVFLGVNGLTGAPIIYDPFLRMNQNVAIVGKSGCGKSYTSKIILSRLAKRHRNLAFFIIDPENEYRYVGQLHGAQVLDIRPDTLLGLDPVQIFASSKDTAAAILSDIIKVQPGSRLYSEVRTLVGAYNTIFDVYANATEELKGYMCNLVDGVDRFLVAGDPPEFSRRMVFNLSPLHEGFQLSERSLTLQAANVLLFSKIWQMIDRPQFTSLQDPKLVIVDEVWMFTSMPSAARFLEGVARRGRKRNVIFITNTQRVADVLESPGGRAVIENCATKILMWQDPAAVGLVGDVFKLSEYEKDMLLDIKAGQAILLAEDVHVPVNFYATDEEHALFTTKPAERLF